MANKEQLCVGTDNRHELSEPLVLHDVAGPRILAQTRRQSLGWLYPHCASFWPFVVRRFLVVIPQDIIIVSCSKWNMPLKTSSFRVSSLPKGTCSPPLLSGHTRTNLGNDFWMPYSSRIPNTYELPRLVRTSPSQRRTTSRTTTRTRTRIFCGSHRMPGIKKLNFKVPTLFQRYGRVLTWRT